MMQRGILTGRPFASLTFLNRSPFGASSIASATCVGVRKTSRNLITFGWLNLQRPLLFRLRHSPVTLLLLQTTALRVLAYSPPEGSRHARRNQRLRRLHAAFGKAMCAGVPGSLAFWADGMLPPGIRYTVQVCANIRGQAGRAKHLGEWHPE